MVIISVNNSRQWHHKTKQQYQYILFSTQFFYGTSTAELSYLPSDTTSIFIFHSHFERNWKASCCQAIFIRRHDCCWASARKLHASVSRLDYERFRTPEKQALWVVWFVFRSESIDFILICIILVAVHVFGPFWTYTQVFVKSNFSNKVYTVSSSISCSTMRSLGTSSVLNINKYGGKRDGKQGRSVRKCLEKRHERSRNRGRTTGRAPPKGLAKLQRNNPRKKPFHVQQCADERCSFLGWHGAGRSRWRFK